MTGDLAVRTLMRSPAAFSAVVAAVILLVYLLRLFMKLKKLDLPIAAIKPGNVSDSLMEARTCYPNTPFILPLTPPWVILPHSLVSEIRGLPEEKISFKKHTYDKFLGRYTGIGEAKKPEAIQAIKIDLTRNVGKILGDLQDEIKYAFDKEIGTCSAWTEIHVFPKIMQIVALLSARAFVGLPLCRDKEWSDATINFTIDAVALMNANSKIPQSLRPFISPFLPELRKLGTYREFAGRKMKPQVDAILSTYREKVRSFKTMNDEDSMSEAIKGNFNLVHWMIGHFKDPEKADAFELGGQQMTAAFAAIHTTGMATTHAIFDLAAHPEYIPELRAEIDSVTAEESDGQLRKVSMAKLKKLDSFIKESQRMSPPTIIAMNRIVTSRSGITLSTGDHLPYNTVVGFGHPFYPTSTVPSNHILREKSQPPLNEFHPFRYSDLRSLNGEENNHQFVASDPNNINFGYGRNACPGRFFASNEIKVILIELLTRYDVGLGPQGQGEGADFKRPKTLEFGSNYAPDPRAKVWFRQRQGV